MRTLVYHVACTLDGFIAHSDHTVDGFSQDEEVVSEYFNALKTDYDAVIMGRKTYEFGLQFGVTSPYPWLQQFVVSQTLESSPDPAVQVVADGVELARTLKQQSGKPIYLCGGGKLAAVLLKEQLIDSLILKLNPILFGKGIPLFEGMDKPAPLKLVSTKPYACGVVLQHYNIM